MPPHVEYRLTPLGKQVGKRVAALADLIENSLPKILDARRELGTRRNDMPLPSRRAISAKRR